MAFRQTMHLVALALAAIATVSGATGTAQDAAAASPSLRGAGSSPPGAAVDRSQQPDAAPAGDVDEILVLSCSCEADICECSPVPEALDTSAPDRDALMNQTRQLAEWWQAHAGHTSHSSCGCLGEACHCGHTGHTVVAGSSSGGGAVVAGGGCGHASHGGCTCIGHAACHCSRSGHTGCWQELPSGNATEGASETADQPTTTDVTENTTELEEALKGQAGQLADWWHAGVWHVGGGHVGGWRAGGWRAGGWRAGGWGRHHVGHTGCGCAYGRCGCNHWGARWR